MMKLDSLQIIPRGEKGWGTKELSFAKAITQLYGANGTGKTPLVKSIAFCLGYPSIFRDDIYVHCSSAILSISIDKAKYKLERKYQTDFDVTVYEPSNSQQKFYNEAEFSRYILELIGYDSPHLITLRNEVTQPYLATVLPIFYLDQDNGYDDFYKAPRNFIKDQFAEMVRVAASFPAKNSFDKKKSLIDAKVIVDRAHKKVYRLKSLYERVLMDSEVGSLSIKELDEQINTLRNLIELTKASKNIKKETTGSIDKLISLKMLQARETQDELNILEKKLSSIKSIKEEIEAEINTLSLNEESRRIFMSFNDICSVKGCGLFLGSNESYGKSLLYLKDQIKDLVITSESSELKVEILKSTLTNYLDDIETFTRERDKVLEDDNLDVVVDVIHKSLSEVIDLEIKKKEKEAIEELEEKYLLAEEELNHAINKQESLSSAPNKSSLDIIRFQTSLKVSIIKWVNIINTKNISTNIDFVDGFKPNYGTEKLKQLSGSTHLRAVLSYHAALFEQINECSPLGFKFLILDTPGQHDISVEDLDLYIMALKAFADENNIQIIFSSTRYMYQPDVNDISWKPLYDDGFEQTMFMGKQ